MIIHLHQNSAQLRVSSHFHLVLKIDGSEIHSTVEITVVHCNKTHQNTVMVSLRYTSTRALDQ